jgi:hypothetical protein
MQRPTAGVERTSDALGDGVSVTDGDMVPDSVTEGDSVGVAVPDSEGVADSVDVVVGVQEADAVIVGVCERVGSMVLEPVRDCSERRREGVGMGAVTKHQRRMGHAGCASRGGERMRGRESERARLADVWCDRGRESKEHRHIERLHERSSR